MLFRLTQAGAACLLVVSLARPHLGPKNSAASLVVVAPRPDPMLPGYWPSTWRAPMRVPGADTAVAQISGKLHTDQTTS